MRELKISNDSKKTVSQSTDLILAQGPLRKVKLSKPGRECQ